MKRQESMGRHPAGRQRVAGLVSQARRQQARDVADRLLVDVEEYMGGPMVPESDEVAQARMDDEACELGSINAEPRPEPVGPVAGALQGFAAGLAAFAAIWAMGMAGQFAGGWPL